MTVDIPEPIELPRPWAKTTRVALIAPEARVGDTEAALQSVLPGTVLTVGLSQGGSPVATHRITSVAVLPSEADAIADAVASIPGLTYQRTDNPDLPGDAARAALATANLQPIVTPPPEFSNG